MFLNSFSSMGCILYFITAEIPAVLFVELSQLQDVYNYISKWRNPQQKSFLWVFSLISSKVELDFCLSLEESVTGDPEQEVRWHAVLFHCKDVNKESFTCCQEDDIRLSSYEGPTAAGKQTQTLYS